VAAPAGVLACPGSEPIRVMETLQPIARTEPAPGVYGFDFGRNISGWCRVQITGPRGTEIKLRHAESLFNGMLNTENLRSALQTDRYTLSGDSTESYEPRFVCHGFRYVEVTGLLRPSDLLSLEAKVVRDALEPAGRFVCSNELLNQIYAAACGS